MQIKSTHKRRSANKGIGLIEWHKQQGHVIGRRWSEIRVPVDMKNCIRAIAHSEGLTMSGFLDKALRNSLWFHEYTYGLFRAQEKLNRDIEGQADLFKAQ